MPMHKRKIRRQTQPIRRPQPKFFRPVIEPFPEEEGAFAAVQRLVEKYRGIVDGHHAAIRQFLEDCLPVVCEFQREPDEFERLKADPFWEEASRQKPKDPSTSKWVLYFAMRAKTKNVRNRAGRYAVVLDGLIREKVRPDMVAARIKEMRGVEAAYLHFLAEELGQNEVTVDADDDEMENEGPPIPRKGGLRAARGRNDDMVQGEDETASPSDKSVGAAIGGRRPTPSFDPERHLLVEDEPDALDAFLDAATTEGVPVSIRLWVTVYPPDATGFVRVVRELGRSDLPEDFSSIDDEDRSSHKSLPSKKPSPLPVRPKGPMGKRKRKLGPWGGRPTSIFTK
jgi:hypothetical protein